MGPFFLRLLVGLSSLTAVIGLLACQKVASTKDVPQFQDDGTKFNVIGGAALLPGDDLYNSVVFIYNSNPKYNAKCTGVLIAKDVVLTAAHCVFEEIYKPSNISVYFNLGSNINTISNTTAKKIIVPQVFIDEYPTQSHYTHFLSKGSDVALVLLSNPAPDNYRQLKILSTMPNNLLFQYFTIAGFGLTSQSENPNHEIKENNSNIKLLKKQITLSLENILKDTQNFTDPTLLFNQKSGGACIGDSGGPVVISQNGEPYLVGIIDFVYNLDNEENFCSGSLLASNVLSQKVWLKENFNKLISSEPNPFDF